MNQRAGFARLHNGFFWSKYSKSLKTLEHSSEMGINWTEKLTPDFEISVKFWIYPCLSGAIHWPRTLSISQFNSLISLLVSFQGVKGVTFISKFPFSMSTLFNGIKITLVCLYFLRKSCNFFLPSLRTSGSTKNLSQFWRFKCKLQQQQHFLTLIAYELKSHD